MDLRALARRDAATILGGDYSAPVVFVAPSGEELATRGTPSAVEASLDADTGVKVGGCYVEVSVPLGAFEASASGLPRGINVAGRRPWLVRMAPGGKPPETFKVEEVRVDQTLGVLLALCVGVTS